LESTEFLQRPPAGIIPWHEIKNPASHKYRFGFVGLSDGRMMPLLRPAARCS
jgi:hypothetical protein